MHTILRYYYTNINRRREQQQQQKRKQNKKKLGEKLVKKKGLDWKVRPFPDVLWCEVEEATPLFMYLTYMYILMDARGTLVCLSLFCGCVCVCVKARKRAGGSRASSFPLSTHTQATEATPIVIGHWLRQRHPQRWPTLKVSLLSFYFPFYIFLFFFSYFAFNTLPWLLGFLFNLFFSPSFLFFFFSLSFFLAL